MKSFPVFPKIARLNREIIVTEKIDGTNASVHIVDLGDTIFDKEYALDNSFSVIDNYAILAGSKKRFIKPENDNFGFSKWVYDNDEVLLKTLGVGSHYGEWWGSGIQRKYGGVPRSFSLFNTRRWNHQNCGPCNVVPIMYQGPYGEFIPGIVLSGLKIFGSVAAPMFMNPEGIVVYHTHANVMFKVTLENDAAGKGQ